MYCKLVKTEQTKVFETEMKEAGLNGKKKWRVIKSHFHLETQKQTIEKLKINDLDVIDKK